MNENRPKNDKFKPIMSYWNTLLRGEVYHWNMTQFGYLNGIF